MNHRSVLFLILLVATLPFALAANEVFSATFTPPSTTITVPPPLDAYCIGTFDVCHAKLRFLNVPTGRYQATFRGGYFRNPPGSERVNVEFSGSGSPIVIPDQFDGNADPWDGVTPIQFITAPTTVTFSVTSAGSTVTLKEVSTATLYSVSPAFATLVKVGELSQPPVINAPNINLPCSGTQTQVNLASFVSDPDTPISSLIFSAIQEPPINKTLGISVSGSIVTITYPANTNLNEKIRYTVTDPDGNSATQVVTFTVTGCAACRAPVWNSQIPSQTIRSGQSFSLFDLDDFSFDQDTPDFLLIYTASGQVLLNVFIDSATHIVSLGYPQGTQNLQETIVFTVRDPDCGPAQSSATFTITPNSGCGLVAGCGVTCPNGFTCVSSTPGGCGGTCQGTTAGCGLVPGCSVQCPQGFSCVNSLPGACGGSCQINTQGCGTVASCTTVCPLGFICMNATLNACGGSCQPSTSGCGSSPSCTTSCPNGFTCASALPGGCGGTCQVSTLGCGSLGSCTTVCPLGFSCMNATPSGCGGTCQPSTTGCGLVPGCGTTCSTGQNCINNLPNGCGGTCCTPPRWDVNPLSTVTIQPGQFFPLFDLDDFSSDPDTLDAFLTYTVAGKIQLTVFIDPITRVVSVGYPLGTTSLDETLVFTVSDGSCGSVVVTKRFIISGSQTAGCGLVPGCSVACGVGFACVGSQPNGCGGICQPSTSGCGLVSGCQNSCTQGFICVNSTPNSCGGTCQPSTIGCGLVPGCQDTCAQSFACTNSVPGSCGGTCQPVTNLTGCGALASCPSPCAPGFGCVGYAPNGCGGVCQPVTNITGCGFVAGCSITCPTGYACSGSTQNGCGGTCTPVGSGCGFAAGCLGCPTGATCVNYTINGCGGVCTNATNQPPTLGPIIGQTVQCLQQFQTFDLDNFAFDPDDADSSLTFTASGFVSLTVSIDPVTHVVTITNPMSRDTSETITFTVTDPDGLSASASAIFVVQGCNFPPIYPPPNYPPMFPPTYPPFLPPPLFGGPSECKISTGHGLLMDANCNKVPDIMETGPLQVAPEMESARQIVQETSKQQALEAPRVRQLRFTTPAERTSKVLVLESRDARGGDSTIFPITITNDGEATHSYQIFAEGIDSWGTYEVSEGSLILIPPHQTREAELRVYAYTSAPAGDKVFSLVVRSGNDVEKTDLRVNILPSLERTVSPFLVNGLIALFVLIVLTLIILGIQLKTSHKKTSQIKRKIKRRR